MRIFSFVMLLNIMLIIMIMVVMLVMEVVTLIVKSNDNGKSSNGDKNLLNDSGA